MKMESKINVHIKETNLDNYLLFYILEKLENVSLDDLDDKKIEFLKIDKEYVTEFFGLGGGLASNINKKIEYLIKSYEK